MKTIKLPDYEVLHQMLKYDNGVLYWKVSPTNGINIGDAVTNKGSDGYSKIGICGRRYKVHRIIYKMHNPDWDEKLKVDHKNNNRSDNRIENLQLATHAENTRKCIMRKNNTSGFKGVTYSKSIRKWISQIRINGKSKTLGSFDNPEDAADAYDKKAVEIFGKYAITNKILLDG